MTVRVQFGPGESRPERHARLANEFFRDLKPGDNWTEKLVALLDDVAIEAVDESALGWTGP